jgi:hypothetical protein
MCEEAKKNEGKLSTILRLNWLPFLHFINRIHEFPPPSSSLTRSSKIKRAIAEK